MTAPTPIDEAGGVWVRQQPLTGDASSRRYVRVWDRAGRTAVVVSYPSEAAAALARDVAVTRWLASIGLRAPQVFGVDPDAGQIVVEDLGPVDAEAALRAAGRQGRSRLMAALVEPLVLLAAQRTEDLPPWNPPLDAARLRWELAGFELWFVRHRRGVTPSRELGRWLDALAAEVGRHPRRVCHRDYHLNNLFVLEEGGVAVIDAQDVLVGPDTYDGVSLLEERAMRQLLTETERRRWRQHWAQETDATDGWQERWAAVRVQRALKVLGTFARLEAVGRTGYGDWLGQVAAALTADAADLRLPAAVADLLLD